MNCLSFDAMNRFLLECESQELLEDFFQHLDACETCQSLFHSISALEKPLASYLAPEKTNGLSSSPSSDPATTQTLAQRDRVPSLFSRFPHLRVIRELGEGGMGRVFHCHDARLDREVAIKVLKRETALPGTIQRIEKEAQIQARFNHPNIVKLHEIGSEDGIPFLVMEYVPGGSLHELLRQGRLSSVQAVTLVRDVARAIQVAHENGVLHRDLKPANILLAGSPGPAGPLTPKVTDFGLAKLLDQSGELSSSQVFAGTPIYMSPEQISASPARNEPTSDLYSLGVILYETLAGRVPFLGENPAEVFGYILNHSPLPLHELNAGISRDLETICLKCLEKEPRNRYRSAGDLADDLDRYLEHRPIVARPVSRLSRTLRWMRRNPLVSSSLGVATLALLGLLAGGVAFVVEQSRLLEEVRNKQELAEENARVAGQRFAQIRENYLREIAEGNANFTEFQHLLVRLKLPLEIRQFGFKLDQQRLKRALELAERPEIADEQSEIMVETFLLAGFGAVRNNDPERGNRHLRKAVDLAKTLAKQGPLGTLGRARAVEAYTWLGFPLFMEKKYQEALPFFQEGWDLFRLRQEESPADPLLKRNSTTLGKHLVDTLEKLGRKDEIEKVRPEYEALRRMPEKDTSPPNPARKPVALLR